MYHPGLGTDRQLAQIRYADFLEEAAIERADRKARAASPKAATRKLVLALAGVAPIVVLMVWVLIAH